jgi:hypothetical protein
VVAFVSSVVITALLVGIIFWYARKREVGQYLTWGDAMVSASYIFFLMFWVYGVVPHQFITWADGELNWRPDRLIAGPGEFITEYVPVDISYQTIRDLIVVGIYGIAIAGNVWLWAWWQKRGQKKDETPEIAASDYGRPLVKADA